MTTNRKLFTNIEKHFTGFPSVLEWELSNEQDYCSLAINFSKRILNDRISIEKAVQSLISEHELKDATYSVYNTNSIPFFGIIINYQKS